MLLITGGTGSFGNAVLNRFLRTDIGEIRIFSRDEKKQDDMRHDFQARMPEVAHKITPRYEKSKPLVFGGLTATFLFALLWYIIRNF